MTLQIIVKSRLDFERILEVHKINDETVEQFSNVAFISIADPIFEGESTIFRSDMTEEYFFKKDHSNVIQLRFYDVTRPIELESGEVLDVITDEQAEELWKFIKRQLRANVGCFLIHCAAGISRSAAVGRFISHYVMITKEDHEVEKEFYYMNPQIHPNSTVFSKLRKAAGWDETHGKYIM